MKNGMELSAVQAARKLGVSLDFVYRLLMTGKLNGRKADKQWRIPVEAVEARLKQRGE